MLRLLHLGWLLPILASAFGAQAVTLLDADFDVDEDGFSYLDDAFLGTSQPAYASGTRIDPGGFSGGALTVQLGGIDGATIVDMSGGWEITFASGTFDPLEFSFRYSLTQSADYESDEFSQVRVTLDGSPIGNGVSEHVTQLNGNGNGGSTIGSGWILWQKNLGSLALGFHTLRIGAYNNKKTLANESTELRIDDVRVETAAPPDPNVQRLVNALDPDAFRSNVETLAGFGSRHWSQPGNLAAGDWIQAELESYGYAVERHTYLFSGQNRDNIYATKVGTVNPDQMYILSGHMDSINFDSPGFVFAPGVDDDASGTSLVMEAARVFALPGVETEKSIRFILWNNEETGLDGSEAYVADRRGLQGIEDPPGSGLFPEPTWLGILQHDMIMWDHGPNPPVQSNQIPEADVDIEYQISAAFAADALVLANAALGANAHYATDYPAEVTSNMNNTDSKSFQDDTAAISLRENQRIAEIGDGANPNWHRDTDVVATYSNADFLLGFNVLQTSVATVAELAGATTSTEVPSLSRGLGALLGAVIVALGLFVRVRRTA